MRLFIAEKPKVGKAIARILPGPAVAHGGYIETSGGTVTWVYGHIFRAAEPGEYDKRYQKWCLDDLPIIPEEWKLSLLDKCEKQFEILKKLIAEADEIIHTGDPDREGQLLIDEILEFIHNTKPVKRLMMRSQDDISIKRGLEKICDNQEYYSLYQSALGRQRGDWLIGMNLSRFYTLIARRAGYQGTLPIGRVKTPTMALVVRREREINDFKSVTYFSVKAHLEYKRRYFTASWVPSDDQQGMDTEKRLIDSSIAKKLQDAFDTTKDEAIITHYETVKQEEDPRLPLSLSDLQKEANRQFGIEPKRTQEIAQTLYERTYTSYPRSDCRYLPESQFEDAKTILANLTFSNHDPLVAWAAQANVTKKSAAWNDKKITAHHAIIPTMVACNFSSLSEEEKNIYTIIAQAYIAQFYPSHVYNQVKAELNWSGEKWKASRRTIINPGWKSLYQTEEQQSHESDSIEDEDNETMPEMMINDSAHVLKTLVTKKATKPPKRFTITTLLEAMEKIHLYVQSPEIKKVLRESKGIGTTATRTSIIDELITSGLLQINKKYLIPTDQAFLLADLLPDELKLPDTTALWENFLNSIRFEGAELNSFLNQQLEIIQSICSKAQDIQIKPLADYVCPECGQGVLQPRKGPTGKFWGCSRYPDCKKTVRDINNKPDLTPPIHCPECNTGILRRYHGSKGYFWGCSNYPSCKKSFDDKRGKPDLKKNTKIPGKTSRFFPKK